MSVFLHKNQPKSYITHTYPQEKITLAYSLQDFG